ncbi:hypothetical protein N7453_011224 [Penicillium expansum]|nr:hypothetical protein N7453_011224 [Penicillium expansum]
MAHVHANAQPSRADAEQTRSPYPSKQKATKFTGAGSILVMPYLNSTEARRRQHADAQKSQRDRMKAALGQMERIMRMGGAGNERTIGTKTNVLTRNLLGQAELLETTVEYIQHLQKQVKELRELGHSSHATLEMDIQRCAGCQD